MLRRNAMRKAVFAIALLASASLMVSCSSDDEDEDDNTFTLNGAGSAATELNGNAPEAAAMSVYQFAVSANEDCSSPSVIIDNGDEPEEFDMLDSPQLGTGEIADGTYPCVIMVMSPELTVTPSVDDGACEEGEEFTQNVCGGVTIDLDGEEQACEDADDKAYLYITTYSRLTNAYQQAEDNCSDEDSCNSFAPPTSDDRYVGVPLEDELVVSGDAVGVFTLDDLSVQDESDDQETACGLDRPTFTFESE